MRYFPPRLIFYLLYFVIWNDASSHFSAMWQLLNKNYNFI